MHIAFIEIQNFRKLKSIRIDFAKDKTLFVGPNNSGKTSAMVALRHFLIDRVFNTNDFTLSCWEKINEIGNKWESSELETLKDFPALEEWVPHLPSMDVWLEVEPHEVHYVRDLLPTLGWEGGKLGVRLRLEPEKIDDFFKEYRASRTASKQTMDAASSTKKGKDKYTLVLWPSDIKDFLDREIDKKFTIKAFLLDPNNLKDPVNGVALPQALPEGSDSLEINPFKKLIKINEINAQRGLSDTYDSRDKSRGANQSSQDKSEGLSDQLRSYWSKHIDPSEMPEPSDIEALQAIHDAQIQFNEKLRTGFNTPFKEVEGMNYPGFHDPKLKLLTKLRPMDGLNHASALQYEVITHAKSMVELPTLPEKYNGLGFQNLISMIFKLMSFRDDWMRVGKAGKKPLDKDSDNIHPAPIHLVLVEEPEAHLHVQVQQVFIRKAYDILRNHINLGKQKDLTTQLVVSTHSSHIVHECEYSSLRYFRRKLAAANGEVPTSTVVNLSDAFGEGEETPRFVKRYLQSMHCDIFFADAVIFVEGAAERMLVPHFIREHFPILHHCYITLLELGGSHAQKFKPLIDKLGLNSLIITDLDSVGGNSGKSEPAKINSKQKTANNTLTKWHPKKDSIDQLVALKKEDKILKDESLFSVAVAYQYLHEAIAANGKDKITFLANTFEVALIFTNLTLFKDLKGNGLIKKLSQAINTITDVEKLNAELFLLVKEATKAEFALDLLFLQDPKALKVPQYISEGLDWLQSELKTKQSDKVDNSEKKAA